MFCHKSFGKSGEKSKSFKTFQIVVVGVFVPARKMMIPKECM